MFSGLGSESTVGVPLRRDRRVFGHIAGVHAVPDALLFGSARPEAGAFARVGGVADHHDTAPIPGMGCEGFWRDPVLHEPS